MTQSRHAFICCIVVLWSMAVAGGTQPVDRFDNVVKWFVFWGGETKDLNQHHDVPNQAFAVDFLVIDSIGKTHKDDRTRLISRAGAREISGS